MAMKVKKIDRQKELLLEEGSRLTKLYPSLSIDAHNSGGALVTGLIDVDRETQYTVDLRIGTNYPDYEPELYCSAKEVPWDWDRHVSPRCGRACLCAYSEIRTHWPLGSDIADFVVGLVYPFFVWQNYYDCHGCPPPSGERSHGKPGIIEALSEILAPIGEVNEQQIRSFLKLLARDNVPGGHERCPCGSGLKLRNCHSDFLRDLRRRIAPRHAKLDLEIAFGLDRTFGTQRVYR